MRTRLVFLDEVALVVVEGRKVVDRYESLVNPDRRIPWGATRVHKITDADVRDAPAFADVLPDVLGRVSRGILVTHNLQFDHRFIERAIVLAKGAQYGLPVTGICTMSMARRRFGYGNASLGAVCARLGVVNQRPHRAAGDAEATKDVFFHFVGRGGANQGNLNKLRQACDVTPIGRGIFPPVA